MELTVSFVSFFALVLAWMVLPASKASVAKEHAPAATKVATAA